MERLLSGVVAAVRRPPPLHLFATLVIVGFRVMMARALCPQLAAEPLLRTRLLWLVLPHVQAGALVACLLLLGPSQGPRPLWDHLCCRPALLPMVWGGIRLRWILYGVVLLRATLVLGLTFRLGVH